MGLPALLVADVLGEDPVTLFVRAFGALCLLKSVDLAVRAPDAVGEPVAALLLAAWIPAAAALTLDHHVRKAGVAIAALVAITLWSSMDLFNQHFVLMAWIGIFIAILDGPLLALVLRVQLTIVYGFGALAKLNPWFLSGDTLAWHAGERLPVPDQAWMPLAFAVVATEGWLAFGLWWRRTRVVSMMLGVVLHLGIVVGMATSVDSLVRMIVFNGLCVVLYLAFVPDGRYGTQRHSAQVSWEVVVPGWDLNPHALSDRGF